MKKLIFLFAMVFAVGMVMAQIDTTNVATTEQIGSNNDVLVKQIGDNNEAESHQYGNQNDAFVKQEGEDNFGIADQLNGDRNELYVTQSGNSNKVFGVQGMIPGYYAEDGITTYNMVSNDNDGTINQMGDNNLADFLQVGSNNDGLIGQNGSGNKAYAYQGWAGNWWGFGGVLANLFTNNSTATIEQINNNNTGAIWQYGGNNNEANILQDGNNNTASIAQGFIYNDYAYDFTYPVYNTQNNYASIDQLGNSNTAKLFQLGNGNLFKLTQNGDGNSVGYDPSASGLLLVRNAYFAQDGNHNKFAGVWKSANNDLVFWEDHVAEQFNGATLDAESYQKGDYNKIGLRQGQDDWALIQQDGIGNEGLLYQYGVDQNQATMLQFGNYNSSQIVQIQQ